MKFVYKLFIAFAAIAISSTAVANDGTIQNKTKSTTFTYKCGSGNSSTPIKPGDNEKYSCFSMLTFFDDKNNDLKIFLGPNCMAASSPGSNYVIYIESKVPNGICNLSIMDK